MPQRVLAQRPVGVLLPVGASPRPDGAARIARSSLRVVAAASGRPRTSAPCDSRVRPALARVVGPRRRSTLVAGVSSAAIQRPRNVAVSSQRCRPSRRRSEGGTGAVRRSSEIHVQRVVSIAAPPRAQHAGDLDDRRLHHRAGPRRSSGCMRIASTHRADLVAALDVELLERLARPLRRRHRDEVGPELARRRTLLGGCGRCRAGTSRASRSSPSGRRSSSARRRGARRRTGSSP